MLQEIFDKAYEKEYSKYKDIASIIVKFAFQNPTTKELHTLIDQQINGLINHA